MSFVRIYFHEKFEAPPAPPGTLKQPYMAGQLLDLLPGGVGTSNPAPPRAQYVLVQADDLIHIEINPPNREVMATHVSPLLVGDAIYQIGPDWTVSVKLAGE